MANYHLAVLKKNYLEKILSGRKGIESRFTRSSRPPFRRVHIGDKIFFKISGGPVCATATAAAVKNFAELTPDKIAALKDQYNHQIAADDEYWQSRADCKYGVLVWLKDAQPIEPVRISKRDWRAWVVLTEKKNFGLLEPKGLK